MQSVVMATEPVLKVAALCGSLREASFHRGLLHAGTLVLFFLVLVYAFGACNTLNRVMLFVWCLLLVVATHVVWLLGVAMEICKDSIKGMEIEYVDITSLPFMNEDLEVNGIYPPAVEAFRKKIEEADCYLFASPEYNYSVTGTWSPLLQISSS